MILVYSCGCCEGAEDFELCRKACRLEERMHDAELEVQSFASNASFLAQYPLTCDDPEYFERGHSTKNQADKVARVAVDLEDLYYKGESYGRCHRPQSSYVVCKIPARVSHLLMSGSKSLRDCRRLLTRSVIPAR
jgi:hypothetical protein